MKVGFVNASPIFEQFSAAKEAQQAYEKEMTDLSRQVEVMEREIKAFADTLRNQEVPVQRGPAEGEAAGAGEAAGGLRQVPAGRRDEGGQAQRGADQADRDRR